MKLTSYQKFVIGLLAFLQFTVILDFMVLSPLSAILLPELHVATSQFGLLVSVYAFSAGASGLLTAGFADKFDRKKLLLLFYVGFIVGTGLCGVATSYHFLLAARIITGVFGGVIGSASMAIATDLFPLELRGRVMGVVQTAFAASQVMGLPIALYLSNLWGWHAPFLMIAGIGAVVGVVIWLGLKPVDAHLKLKNDRNAFQHLFKTVTHPTYVRGFTATILLATGGFMLMPFGAAYVVNNVGVSLKHLPLIYLVTGISAMIAGPVLGRISDAVGKFPVFCFGTGLGIFMVTIYCHLGITPLWGVMLVNVFLFLGISARMVSTSALISAVPEAKDRGAFMSVNSSLQQFAGGLSSGIAGLVVVQTSSGRLERYDVLGYIVAGAMLVTIVLMYSVQKIVAEKTARAKQQAAPPMTGAVAVPE